MQKKKNGKLVNVLLWILIAVSLLLGAGLLFYPTVSNWYNTSHTSRAVAGYEKAISYMSEIEAQAMLSAAKAYNDSLYQDQNRWEPDEERHKEYESLLDMTGTGIMGYIEIPCISVKLWNPKPGPIPAARQQAMRKTLPQIPRKTASPPNPMSIRTPAMRIG